MVKKTVTEVLKMLPKATFRPCLNGGTVTLLEGSIERVLMGVTNYQLTTNFSANCQLTTIFLGQLSVNC